MNQERLPKTYTVKQIAEILRVHVDTIRRQIRKGNIKTIKVGRHYLILEDELDRLLKEGWKGLQLGPGAKKGQNQTKVPKPS